ncbi:MAG: hypothetical protein ABTR92_00470, partial [Candidatus Accumulibacter phosphatis]
CRKTWCWRRFLRGSERLRAIGEADCETPTVAFIETQMHLADYDGNLYLPASRGDSNIRAYQAIFEQLWKQATPAIEA